MMNGSALTDANSDSRLSDVVEAFTLLPVITKCSARGSPSQPLPNILIVLIVFPSSYFIETPWSRLNFKCVIQLK